MVHTYNRIPLDSENEWSTTSPEIISKSHKHKIEWNKQDTEEGMLYVSIYTNFKHRHLYIYGDNSQDVVTLGHGDQCLEMGVACPFLSKDWWHRCDSMKSLQAKIYFFTLPIVCYTSVKSFKELNI